MTDYVARLAPDKYRSQAQVMLLPVPVYRMWLTFELKSQEEGLTGSMTTERTVRV